MCCRFRCTCSSSLNFILKQLRELLFSFLAKKWSFPLRNLLRMSTVWPHLGRSYFDSNCPWMNSKSSLSMFFFLRCKCLFSLNNWFAVWKTVLAKLVGMQKTFLMKYFFSSIQQFRGSLESSSVLGSMNVLEHFLHLFLSTVFLRQ